ncbi:MAG: hypothetical protein MMC33_008216 [Icmadophila ericetorum]|nr:hypothetical protein [Icmadophila ericetorum]
MDNRKEYSRLWTSDPSGLIGNAEYVYSTRRRERVLYHIIAYITLMLLNVVLFVLWFNASSDQVGCVRPMLTFSPAKAAGVIKYEKKRLSRKLYDNPFTGQPRSEHELAWRNLLQPMTSKFSPAEYAQSEIGDTLAYRDGSGYVLEMAVYHELHCIRQIRRHLYLDHYYPNISADDLSRETLHIDHCLEYFREAAMCRGDTSLATMFWRDGLPTSRVYSEHECVNWEALDSWAREKMVDMHNPDVLEVKDQAHRYDLMTTAQGKTVKVGDPNAVEVHP